MNTLTATELAVEWRDAGHEPEWHASDGTFIFRYVMLDFDYDMAYLLRIDQDRWLCYRQLHGAHPGDTEGVTVEWLAPDEDYEDWLWDPMHRFVEWTRQVMCGSF